MSHRRGALLFAAVQQREDRRGVRRQIISSRVSVRFDFNSKTVSCLKSHCLRRRPLHDSATTHKHTGRQNSKTTANDDSSCVLLYGTARGTREKNNRNGFLPPPFKSVGGSRCPTTCTPCTSYYYYTTYNVKYITINDETRNGKTSATLARRRRGRIHTHTHTMRRSSSMSVRPSVRFTSPAR